MGRSHESTRTEIEYSDPLRLRRGCLLFHTTSPGGVSPRRRVCRVFQEGSPALMPLQRASALPAPNSPLTTAPPPAKPCSQPLPASSIIPPSLQDGAPALPSAALRCAREWVASHGPFESLPSGAWHGWRGTWHTHTHQCTHTCRSDRFRAASFRISPSFSLHSEPQSRLTPRRSRRPSSSLQRLPRSRLFQ